MGQFLFKNRYLLGFPRLTNLMRAVKVGPR